MNQSQYSKPKTTFMFYKQISIVFLILLFALQIKSQDIKPITISEWVNEPEPGQLKSPLIFVDFWATWCRPCIVSMTHTQSLAKEFPNVLFLYMSEEPKTKIETFMLRHDKSFIAGLDWSGENVTNYEVNSLPQSALLDPEGKVLWKGNPTEMNSGLLSEYLRKYKNVKGKANRINQKKAVSTDLEWNTFKADDFDIKYIESADATNEYYVDEEKNHYFSGEIKRLISLIFEIPISQVIVENGCQQKYMLSWNSTDDQSIKKSIEQFLRKIGNIEINKKKKRQIVHLIEETKDENFLNVEMYNFEKGDKVSLIDEYSIMIDNATIEEMLTILSENSGYNFIYKGRNKQKYDWNIQYNDKPQVYQQLTDELDFKIIEKERKVSYFYISGK